MVGLGRHDIFHGTLRCGGASREHIDTSRTRAAAGQRDRLTVFRAFAEVMSAGLSYRNECVLLPGGAFSPFGGTYKEVPSDVVYTPAPMIRLEIDNGDRKPVLYEAMPDRNCGRIFRRLTANLSIAPGVYPRPPPTVVPGLSLDNFRNNLRIKVAAVDPQVLGRTVEVSVLAPLGFKTSLVARCWRSLAKKAT